ncbi:MAG TPA: sterol carrier family protein [Mycobacteriales bacterium]|nr:sterol carrier family protein [Mycobacteriales bacterium]
MRAAWLAVVDIVSGLPDEVFDLPTRLGDWRVSELVAHLARNPAHIARMLDAPDPRGRRIGPSEYYEPGGPDARIAARAVTEADGKTPEDLRGETRAGTAAALDLLAGLADDQLLHMGSRSIRLADYLPTRCVEACVHSLDLSDATGADPRLDRAALGVATRLLTGILAERVPGHSVELRVPPYAAVQCVAGPRHTRGTPPNVVEVEPVTWIEIATGRLSWDSAVDAGQIRASGERADISEHLPVLS